MELTIYSYGYSEIIYQTLNALGMFRNSTFYPAVINTMVLIIGAITVVRMAASGIDQRFRQNLFQILGILVFVNGLLLPTTSMMIHDQVEKRQERVDNIPLAFALPIGVIEEYGHLLTQGFELAFSYIDGRGMDGVNSKSANSYYNYGTVFGARLSKEVLEAKFTDPEVINNMRNFIERCIVVPSMIGKQFTKEELMATSNIWELVSKNAGTISRVDLTENGIHSVPTCKEAVNYFNSKFAEADEGFIKKIMNKFRGAGGDSNVYNAGARKLNQNIRKSISAIFSINSQQSVTNILKHNMMINSLNDYRAGKFPNARAQMHAEAGGLLSGDMAEKTLTGSLAVMKVLIYGSFIFLLPLLMLTGGIRKYSMWIMAAFSLQLWPPLFSMLNMVIDVAYDPAQIVSYSTWSTELKKFDSIASTAANMTLMIPFLAMWITKMGEGGFMHLAGSVMASSNSAVGAIAGEKSSGTIAYDNQNIRNSSMDMHNSGKVDHNMQYVSGGQSSIMPDGTRLQSYEGGGVIMTGGAGVTSSSGEAGYNLGSGVEAIAQQNYEEARANSESIHQSYSESKANTISKAVNYLEQIGNHTRTAEGYNIDRSTEEGKAVHKTLTDIDALNQTNDHGWNQNARAYLDGEAGLSIGKQNSSNGWLLDKLKNFNLFGFNISIKAGGSVSAENTSAQGVGDTNTINDENSVSKTHNNTNRANHSENFAKELEKGQILGKDYRESFEDTKRLEKSEAISQDKLKRASDTLNYSRNNSAHTNQDVYQDVFDGVAEEVGSYTKAKMLVDKRDPVAIRVFDRIAKKEFTEIENNLKRKENHMSDAAFEQQSQEFKKNHQDQITDDVGKTATNMAEANNLSKDGVKATQAEVEAKNKDQFYTKSDDNINHYNDTKEKINSDKKKLEEEIKGYDDNRKAIQKAWSLPKPLHIGRDEEG